MTRGIGNRQKKVVMPRRAFVRSAPGERPKPPARPAPSPRPNKTKK